MQIKFYTFEIMKNVSLVVSLLLLLGCGTAKPVKFEVADTESKKGKETPRFLNIKIFEQADAKGIGPCEPSIFINPKHPNHIVAGSVLNYVHHSEDGGKTWDTERLTSSLGVWGDPVITADSEGTFYYFHLSDPEGTNWMSDQILDRIVVQKSLDYGKTWGDGIGIGLNPPKQQDKEWSTVDPDTGHIYTAWTEFDAYKSAAPEDKSRILFSTSSDQGQHWSAPIAISEYEGDCLDGDQTTEGALPISYKGEIYVAWAYDHRIWFDRSTDQGKTWLDKDIVVTEQKAGWNFDVPGLGRTNGMPVLDVDRSDSPHAGTLYINWSDQKENGDTDIFLSRSKDQGQTWSTPSRVNTDTTTTHQFMTWMSIDPSSGYLYILYYDRSQYTDNRTDVTLSVSKDGGNSFISYKISETPFDPSGSGFFGDYTNIHAANGVIRPIWTRYANRKIGVWTALIDADQL